MMNITPSDIAELTRLRHSLHRQPECSGHEDATARRMKTELDALGPDHMETGLGGHGLAVVFRGQAPGPTVMFRCELDALPIPEETGVHHRSVIEGTAHLCGHDGHMAILTGLGQQLARTRPARGRVILLFQPAEETGAGAAAVLADPRFAPFVPDYAFALHNAPGLPLGHVALRSGPVNCASRGLSLTLKGTAAHASQPETGNSPMPALATLMPELTALSHGDSGDADFALVTVTHARLGAPAFGIAPGEATLFATLRTLTDDRMETLCEAALDCVRSAMRRHDLKASHEYQDIFPHCENHPDATRLLQEALDQLRLPYDETGLPWRPSEDFGQFGKVARSAMLFLGAGRDHPPLHNPRYDFPDALIPIGIRIFEQVTRDLLG